LKLLKLFGKVNYLYGNGNWQMVCLSLFDSQQVIVLFIFNM